MKTKVLILIAAMAAMLIAAVPASAAQIWAAGDIAEQTWTAGSPQQFTANIISDPSNAPTWVIPLGDAAYESTPGSGPTLADFMNSYDPAWGTFNTVVKPVPGNHDYLAVPPQDGYRQYFGFPASPSPLYYSWTGSGWLYIVLDSDDAINGGATPSAQYTWLKNLLNANTQGCIAAFYHRPRYSSSTVGNYGSMGAAFTLMYNKGVDVVLNGHAHVYERTDKIDSAGNVTTSTSQGITELVVGTGGAALQSLGTAAAYDKFRDNTHFGVLKFVTSPGSWSAKWFTDVPTGHAPADQILNQNCNTP